MEDLTENAEQVYPLNSELPPRHLCDFYFCGVGGPIGGDDFEAVPRLWSATSDVTSLIKSKDFERFCAELELTSQREIGESIRRRAYEIIAMCSDAESAVERAREVATKRANSLCFEFIGAQNPEEHESLISWTDLEMGMSLFGSINGDPDRRKTLAAAICEGPPVVITLHPPGFKPMSDPKVIAQDYWVGLRDANLAIIHIRCDLRHEIDLFVEYLKVMSENEQRREAAQPEAPPDARATDADEDGEQAPPLTPHQVRVLATMARFDSSRLLSADMIEGEIDEAKRLSARTIGPIVNRLIKLGLAERPEGKRSGARLTRSGRIPAQKIAD